MSRRGVILRVCLALVAVLVLGAAALLFHPSVQYVLVAASYQVEVLWGRVPVDDPRVAERFSAEELETLALVPGIKDHARALGLADTGHYSTVNPTWERTIWNVSACEELSFETRTWWFPIVGQVPYLGFFDETQARAQAEILRSEGLDVHVRTAGAWSTLGWFEDPLLPGMLSWTESHLANTLFHELTHATVWVPGSVAFNESLANFVGDEAALDYLVTRYGEDSPIVRSEHARRSDRGVYLRMMHEVYLELDALYTNPTLSDAVKRSRKQAILDGLADRARAEPFSDPERWATFFEERSWNNARLAQHKVYNRSPAQFATLRSSVPDLGAFLDEIEALAARGGDPYANLEARTAR